MLQDLPLFLLVFASGGVLAAFCCAFLVYKRVKATVGRPRGKGSVESPRRVTPWSSVTPFTAEADHEVELHGEVLLILTFSTPLLLPPPLTSSHLL